MNNLKTGLFLVLLAALFLRAYGINWGLPSKDYYFSYHSDEVAYLKGLGQMSPEKLDFNPHYFNWGTGHYFELGAVIKLAGIFGIVTLTKDKQFYYEHPQEMAKIYLAGRFLSLFFALATVLLVFWIARMIYNERAGLLAAFFTAVNPAHIIHSHYLKADTSVTFWITLLLLGSLLILKSGRLIWYALSGITAGFAASSQQSGICFAHTILIAHILREYRPGRVGFIKDTLFSKKLLIGYAGFLIAYLLTSPYIYLSAAEFFSGVRGVIMRHGGGVDTVNRVHIVWDTFRAFGLGLTPFFTIFAIAALISGIMSRNKPVWLVVLWLMPYLFIIVLSGALNTRHQMLVYPGVFLLAAGFTQLAYSRIRNRCLKVSFIACIALASLYAACYSYAYDRVLVARTIQDESSEWILRNIPAGAEIGLAEHPEIRYSPALIHQVYYYRKGPDYVIRDLKCDVGNLRLEEPEYVIISKREGFRAPENIRDKLTQDFSAEVERRYKVIKVFERYPEIFGLKFRPDFFVSDWEIPFPVIYILRIRDSR